MVAKLAVVCRNDLKAKQITNVIDETRKVTYVVTANVFVTVSIGFQRKYGRILLKSFG